MKARALCSPFLPEEIRIEIEKISGAPCIAIPPSEALPVPINHHPDMLFFNPPNERTTILSKGYHTVNLRFFRELSSENLILDDAHIGNKYPQDIAFDAIGINDTLYCLEAYTAESIKRRFPRVVNIKQGYAACSTLILNNRAAVTADKNIAKALSADGITVLSISPDGIALPGYGCGFIGGASAVVNGTAIFFGNLKMHPDGEEILAFCSKAGLQTSDFPHFPLTDYGSIRYVYEK